MTKSLLIKNIQSLLQIEQNPVKGKAMSVVPAINDAWLLVRDGVIHSYGEMKAGLPDVDNAEVKDATGKIVMPAFCDSHTHIVYAGSREGEFNDRLRGLTYQEIAARGGGILNSAAKLREASEELLLENALRRIDEQISLGTGAIEIKSGYGLSLESELKMLRVIRKIKEISPLTIKSTFLGAHAVPPEFKDKKDLYIAHIIDVMLPVIADEGLADYCDVFCEQNYFTQEETEKILRAALKYNIRPKVHANQLSRSGGVQAGVAVNAVSVDHLEYLEEEEINLLASSTVIPTLLPGAQFFLQLPQPPARTMIEKGLCVAVASDYNPGSSPTGNMQLMMALCCVLYKMTPEEALNAVTINSAAAMNVNDQLGSMAIGKKANIIITKPVPSLAYLPYSFGSNLVEEIIVDGVTLKKNN
ncbi:MAG: imidazolonepropionase [Bacteroidota bacterium]